MMLDDCYKEKSKKTTNSGMLGTWDKSSGMGTSQVGWGLAKLDMAFWTCQVWDKASSTC